MRGRLDREGWKITTNKRPGQKAGALLIGPNGERVAAGRVDRAATLSRLEARLGRAPRALAGQQVEAGQQRPGDIAAPAPHVRGRRGPDLMRPDGRRKKRGGAEAKAKAAAQQSIAALAGLMTGAAGGLSRHRRPGRGPRLGL